MIPTKVGATLWTDDFEILKKIGPEAYDNWKEEGGETILNHCLSDKSDYYLIVGKNFYEKYRGRERDNSRVFCVGKNEWGELKFCIKVCFESGDGSSLTSTNNGATLSYGGWNKLIFQLDEISMGIEEMKKFINRDI